MALQYQVLPHSVIRGQVLLIRRYDVLSLYTGEHQRVIEPPVPKLRVSIHSLSAKKLRRLDRWIDDEFLPDRPTPAADADEICVSKVWNR